MKKVVPWMDDKPLSLWSAQTPPTKMLHNKLLVPPPLLRLRIISHVHVPVVPVPSATASRDLHASRDFTVRCLGVVVVVVVVAGFPLQPLHFARLKLGQVLRK